jgi:hypothetical protein
MAVVLVAVVTRPAKYPSAVLLEVVVTVDNADRPTAVFELPIVFSVSAAAPIAILSAAVLLVSALIPIPIA